MSKAEDDRPIGFSDAQSGSNYFSQTGNAEASYQKDMTSPPPDSSPGSPPTYKKPPMMLPPESFMINPDRPPEPPAGMMRYPPPQFMPQMGFGGMPFDMPSPFPYPPPGYPGMRPFGMHPGAFGGRGYAMMAPNMMTPFQQFSPPSDRQLPRGRMDHLPVPPMSQPLTQKISEDYDDGPGGGSSMPDPPPEYAYHYDAKLIYSEEDPSDDGGKKRKWKRAIYRCTYPCVSWNARANSWLVYYEDSEGRKSKTFNPKKLQRVANQPSEIREFLMNLDPIEASMHQACAFAAQVRWHAKIRKPQVKPDEFTPPPRHLGPMSPEAMGLSPPKYFESQMMPPMAMGPRPRPPPKFSPEELEELTKSQENPKIPVWQKTIIGVPITEMVPMNEVGMGLAVEESPLEALKRARQSLGEGISDNDVLRAIGGDAAKSEAEESRNGEA